MVTVSTAKSHPSSLNCGHSIQYPMTLNPGKSIVCFYCRQPGYIQKRCFLHLAHMCKEEQTVTSKPWLVPRAQKIVVVLGLPPRVEAQMENLSLPVLDSGSARSLISFNNFQQLCLADPKVSYYQKTWLM